MLCPGRRLVAKFGGSSMRRNFDEAVSFTARLWDAGEVAVVVSALKGVTDALLMLAETGDGIGGIGELHRDFALRHGLDPSIFSPLLRELRKSVESRDSFPSLRAFRDHVVSFGELLSARAFAEALSSRGIPVVLFDPWEVIATDGNFGNAGVNFRETLSRSAPVREAVEEGFVAVVPGFIGGHLDLRTTLGRNGSDYTASVLGEAIGADAVLIMGDVDGIYTADPRRVPFARPVPFVSRERARVASLLGMRALHPRATEFEVPLLLGRTDDWAFSTVVGDTDSGTPIIAHTREGGLFRVSVVGADAVHGYEGETFELDGVRVVSFWVERSSLGGFLNSLHWALMGTRKLAFPVVV
ncbi:aspartate kinase [Thermococcus sp. 21S7]|uniref:aspartate kinase n=1 Tax=Thermococcus sp. 21S7 TaxID=1638221 RepID=UPI001438D0FD|nr:aspartate kinase [Thermococcus sp. 21S7]NJE61746.1 aspartate kinase [Thermococcus sp. 21S7]